MNKKELELYVHIPFCVKKCDYCDFLSFSCSDEAKVSYTRALLKEIDSQPDMEDYQVVSIFFGGGTPSLMEIDLMQKITEQIRGKFHISDQAEITLEANPGTLTMEKLQAYLQMGFNRISIGCQSLSNTELIRLGRIHTAEEFYESFLLARNAGFDNINVDLMSALPGQTFENWERNLREMADLAPEHISAYSLILEERTPFFQKQCDLDLPDEDTERLMYEKTQDILREYGYHQYEISNYAKAGYECRHNIGYWKRVPYLGFGLGASSLKNEERYSNTSDWKEYLKKSDRPESIKKSCEKLSRKDQIEEYMILGLRMNCGVSEKDFSGQFGCTFDDIYHDVINKYVKTGYVQRTEGKITLTRKGISVSNIIMADFIL